MPTSTIAARDTAESSNEIRSAGLARGELRLDPMSPWRRIPISGSTKNAAATHDRGGRRYVEGGGPKARS